MALFLNLQKGQIAGQTIKILIPGLSLYIHWPSLLCALLSHPIFLFPPSVLTKT
jgi:hypothetical protein